MIPAAEHQRRDEAVSRFVAASLRGDRDRALISMPALNWPDAWPAVLRELVVTGFSPPVILVDEGIFPESPRVLFRGQSQADYERGNLGIWWTPYPRFAEWFARSVPRTHLGQRVILAALDPAAAILHRVNDEQFIVDPARLDHVELIATPPPYTPEEEDRDVNETSMLDRVPHGYAVAAVAEWRERVVGRVPRV